MAIVKAEQKTITENYSTEQLDLIKNTIAKEATDEQLKLFLYQANRTGLDPLAKQIHCVMRWNNTTRQKDMSIQIAIDGFRLIADRTGKYAGSDDAVYDSEEKSNPNKATMTVYKMVEGVRCAFTATARWKEYCPSNDKMAFMWRKMPYVMIAKCAEALALRKAFPAELSGLYSDDEMHQADKPEKKVEEVVEAEEVKTEIADENKEPIETDQENENTEEIQTRPCVVCGKEVEVGDEHDFDGECLCDEHYKRVDNATEKNLDSMLKPKKITVKYDGQEIETNGVNAKQIGQIADYCDENDAQKDQVLHFLGEKEVQNIRGLTYEQAEAFIALVSTPANKTQKSDVARKAFWAKADEIMGYNKKQLTKGLKRIYYELFGIESMAKMTLEQWISARKQLEKVIESGTQKDFILLAKERS